MPANSSFSFRAPRAATVFLLASLAATCIEVLVPWWLGPGRADLFSAAGALARQLADHIAPPPSLVSAGSAHAQAALHIFLGLAASLCAVFVGAQLALTGSRHRTAAARGRLLALQMAAAVTLHSVVLAMVLAAMLPRYLAPRRALAALGVLLAASLGGIAVLAFAVAPADLPSSDSGRIAAVLYSMLEQLVVLLTFGFGWLAARERRSRLAMAAQHAELLGTQALLADTVRAGERLRIARDLHDAIGHHLTALQLHLDLACRKAGDGAGPELVTAHGLARALLAQVREVVGSERAERGLDLRLALERLCAGIPQPAIGLQVASDLAVHSPAVAYALFSCVQEAVSNAVRHAGAGSLAIALARQGDMLHASVEDDGCGRAGAAEGNGLRGMRERLALLGGTLQLCDAPQRGLRLEIALPLNGSQA